MWEYHNIITIYYSQNFLPLITDILKIIKKIKKPLTAHNVNLKNDQVEEITKKLNKKK